MHHLHVLKAPSVKVKLQSSSTTTEQAENQHNNIFPSPHNTSKKEKNEAERRKAGEQSNAAFWFGEIIARQSAGYMCDSLFSW